MSKAFAFEAESKQDGSSCCAKPMARASLLQRLTKASNLESFADLSPAFEFDDDVRGLAIGHLTLFYSIPSAPASSPATQRTSDCSCSSSSSSRSRDASRWLLPRIRREVGETRLSVSNFDLNAVSPTSW